MVWVVGVAERGRAAETVLRLLGPVQAQIAGRPVDTGPGKQRCVFAALLLDAGQPVPFDALIDRVWDARPPNRARGVLATYVARLRVALRAAGCPDDVLNLRTAFGGYLADCDPLLVDLHQARHLVATARPLADPALAADVLQQAVEVWQPLVLAGVPGEWAERIRYGLSRERTSVIVQWAQTQVTLGNYDAVIARLQPMLSEQPTAEDVAEPLLAALAGAGQVTQAQECYARLRQAIADELGSEPSPRLRDLHVRILQGRLPASVSTPAPGGGNPIPAQLPALTAAFVGRAEALARLDALVAENNQSTTGIHPPAVLISTIAGTAGVGKTTLAVYWAHRVRDRFPDGQLYVDLHGFAPTAPLSPAQVLARFLVALGVSGERIPGEVDQAAALYRTLLAGRRMLIVLDNARDTDQVRPLLPGDDRSLVLVTSRNRLDGLVAREGAARILLDVLPAHESRQLLLQMLDGQRTAAEPGAVDELAELCGHLPLALRIAAARIAGDPQETIGAYRDQLRGADRLDALEVSDDRQTAVRAAVELSYAAMPDPAQRLFRLLGLTDGPDYGLEAIAALLGAPATQASRPLTYLASAHLVERPRPGRYALHDLLRLCAAEYATAAETPEVRAAAIGRLYAYYVQTADQASQLLKPQTLRLPPAASWCPPGEPQPGATRFQNRSEASAWLADELPNLVAAARAAAALGPRPAAWSLAAVLRGYFQSGALVEGEAIARAGLDAALAERHPVGEAISRICMADVLGGMSRYDEAFDQYGKALGITREIGWREGEATVLGNLAQKQHLAGLLQVAVDNLHRALTLNESTGWLQGQAVNHTNLGVVYWDLGLLEEAGKQYERAAQLYHQIGSYAGEAIALTNLGEAIHALGDRAKALEVLNRALALHREIGNRVGEAYTLRCAAAVWRDLGAQGSAMRLAKMALQVIRRIGHRRYEADTLNVLGSIHERRGQLCDAITYRREALDLARELGTPIPQVEALIGLAVAHCRMGAIGEARRYAEQAVAISQRGETVNLRSRALSVLEDVRRSAAVPGA